MVSEIGTYIHLFMFFLLLLRLLCICISITVIFRTNRKVCIKQDMRIVHDMYLLHNLFAPTFHLEKICDRLANVKQYLKYIIYPYIDLCYIDSRLGQEIVKINLEITSKQDCDAFILKKIFKWLKKGGF